MMALGSLSVERVREARRQLIVFLSPDGGPLPNYGAFSDLLEASRQWIEDREEPRESETESF